MGGGCIASLDVQNNQFKGGVGGIGVAFANQGTIRITGNTFTGLSFDGIYFDRNVKVDEVSGNTVQSSFRGMYVNAGDGSIAKIRNNHFVGNSVGVDMTQPITGSYDFGTSQSPGGNEFRCNSRNDGAAGVDFSQPQPADPNAQVFAYGNLWDHQPPTASSAPTNGLDVVLPSSGPMPVTDGALPTVSTPCPSGQTP
jgi:nitrous oxidase accessory protein NosD